MTGAGARRRHFLLTAVLAAMLACSVHGAEPILIDGVAAYVNAHVITISDVMTGMDPVRRKLVSKYSGRELREQLHLAYVDAVNAAIDRQLVIDLYEAGEARLPEWLVNQRAETFIRETFDGDRAALMKALTEEMITYEAWKRQMEEQLIIASMRGSSVESQATVSPEDVRRYYDEHLELFASPSSIHLGMIMLIKEKGSTAEADRAHASAVRARLTADEAFADVARDVSAGSKAASGGDWGWISPGKLRPELATAIETIAAGEISELIETEGEYYILRIEARREATQTTFGEAQPEIERKLRRARAGELYKAWLSRLRRNAYIKVTDLELF